MHFVEMRDYYIAEIVVYVVGGEIDLLKYFYC